MCEKPASDAILKIVEDRNQTTARQIASETGRDLADVEADLATMQRNSKVRQPRAGIFMLGAKGKRLTPDEALDRNVEPVRLIVTAWDSAVFYRDPITEALFPGK